MAPSSVPEKTSLKLLPFTLDKLRLALSVDAVDRVLRSVSLTPLPSAPSIVAGVVDIHGAIVPVIDLRKRLFLPVREVDPADQMVVARMAAAGRPPDATMTVALLVDSTDSVVEVEEAEVVRAESIVPGLESVHGIARLPNGLLLVHDLDRCLSLQEAELLERVLESERDA